VKWFQVDSDAPNDPKLKAIIRHGIDPSRGQSAAGAMFLLWCYIANHGEGEPGLGIRADGTPLALDEMAEECLFNDVASLTTFLAAIAGRGHVHQDIWTRKGIVFLPAMWIRVSAYYRSKARKLEHDTVQDLVRAVLATDGPIRPAKALPTKPNQPTKPGKKNVGGGEQTDLLADGGSDQVDALVHLWNTERKPGPLLKSISAKRRSDILKRLKDHPNLDDWRKVIRYVNGQKWCNGHGTGDHVNFVMGLDTLLKPGRFEAALERASLDRKHGTQDGTVGRDAATGRTGFTPGKFAAAMAGGDHETAK
jgi:hypothetical protein